MLVKMQCPHCGANMDVNDELDMVVCTYCGTKIANLKQKVEVTQNVNVNGVVKHVMDRSNDPNLIISYATTNPSVVMVVRIVQTGQKNTYLNGQTQTYHLRAGTHQIVLKIGKKNYDRTIVIPADNSPVRINAAYTGRRAEITIDQPNVGSECQQAIRSNNIVGGGKSPMSIVAFILSLTGVLSVIGVLLAIIDLICSKKDNRHSHGMSIAALIIGTIFSIVFIFAIISSTLKSADNQNESTVAVADKDSLKPNKGSAATKKPTNTSKPTVTKKPANTAKEPQYTSKIVKFDVSPGKYGDGYEYTAIVEIYNTGSGNIYLKDATFDIEDSSGHLLQTEDLWVYTYRSVVKPGEKGYFYTGTAIKLDTMPEDGAVSLNAHMKIKATKHEPLNYEVSDTSLAQGTFGIKTIGRVTNHTNKDDSLVYVRVAYYDAKGTILGISGTNVAGLDAGATVSFEISGLYMNDDFSIEDVASYEVLAQDTYYDY